MNQPASEQPEADSGMELNPSPSVGSIEGMVDRPLLAGPVTSVYLDMPALAAGRRGFVVAPGGMRRAVEASAPQPKEGWITMRQAAARLHCSYCWLSRKWRDLGLRPSRVAREFLFSARELDDVIGAHRIRRRGRPRMG